MTGLSVSGIGDEIENFSSSIRIGANVGAGVVERGMAVPQKDIGDGSGISRYARVSGSA